MFQPHQTTPPSFTVPPVRNKAEPALGPSSTQVELQRLLLQSSKLTAQLSTLSTFPVVNRSPAVLAGRMESLARNTKPTDTQLAAIVESVKADPRIRKLMECEERAMDKKDNVNRPATTTSVDQSRTFDSIEKLITLKKAEAEANKKREEEDKRRDAIKNLINFNKVPHFVNCLSRFNEARLRKNGGGGGKFAIFEALGECSREAQNDIRLEQLLDCWNALAVLTGETELGTGDEDVFSSAPLSAPHSKSQSDPAMWPSLLARRSRRVLEMSYVKFIDRTLAQNPRDVLSTGKQPTMLERVKAYCAIRAKRLPPSEIERIEVYNGVAPWMIIFYLLRCGLFKDIQEQLHLSSNFHSRTDPVLTGFLRTFLDTATITGGGGLSLQTRAQVQAEYNQRHLQGSQDPFKMALMKIIGRCDLHKKTIPDLLLSSEDYLWLQLWLIKEDEPSNPSTFCLRDLQKTICDFGADYFSGAHGGGRPGNPLNYFQMLLLTGQFEKAINGLLMTGYHLEAVHVAIGCLYHDRITVIGHSSSNDVSGDQVVDLYTIICDFLPALKGVTDKAGELQYLVCLSLSDKLVEQAQSMVRHLVTAEGADFVELLGDVLSDGMKRDGLVKHYAPLLRLENQQDYIKTIVTVSAERCVQERRLVEALQLYNLCGQYEQVLRVLCGELAAVFCQPFNKDQQRQLTDMAQSILDYYEQQPTIQSALSGSDLQQESLLLLRCLQVKQLASEHEWERALSSVELLDMMPMTTGGDDDDMTVLQGAAERLLQLGNQLSVIRSDLLLLTMTIVWQCYRRLRSTVIIDSGRQAQIDGLRSKARCLLVLVGLMQGKVKADVASEMARLEVTMV